MLDGAPARPGLPLALRFEQCGFRVLGFDIDARRYGRIIFMADADSDGAHIRCLLTTLFFKYMPDLIAEGRVWVNGEPVTPGGETISTSYPSRSSPPASPWMCTASTSRPCVPGSRSPPQWCTTPPRG